MRQILVKTTARPAESLRPHLVADDGGEQRIERAAARAAATRRRARGVGSTALGQIRTCARCAVAAAVAANVRARASSARSQTTEPVGADAAGATIFAGATALPGGRTCAHCVLARRSRGAAT